MSDVAIKYNNETIGELNESGTATLKTSQKRCVSDIEVEYTKPNVPQTATINFYEESGKDTILKDTVTQNLGVYVNEVINVTGYNDNFTMTLRKNGNPVSKPGVVKTYNPLSLTGEVVEFKFL